MSKPTSSTPTQNLSAALADLVASAAPGVVAIHSSRSRSSGFVWRPGLIITADETLSEEDEFIVTLSGGDTVAAHLVGRDPTTDIALLRVESDLQPFSLTESPMVAGALVVAVGAEEDASTVALGVVSRASGPWRSLRGEILTLGSSLICAYERAPKAALCWTQVGRRSAWRFLGRVDVCSSSQQQQSSASRQNSLAMGASHAVISD